MGVVGGCPRFGVVEVATQHCEELICILERVDADERGVIPRVYVADGARLHCGGPFKVPPELGFRAEASGNGEAGITVHYTVGDPGYQV